jgi:hypothetical protein
MIRELMHDFADTVTAMAAQHRMQRLVGLLQEALQIDAQFLSRYPESLLQAVWYRGWWSDAADETRTSLRERLSNMSAPAQWTGESLSGFLEAWKRHRAEYKLLHPLIPPRVMVGGIHGQTIHGHVQDVRDIALSRQGRIYATAGGDSVVRIWDASSGV